MFKKKKLPWFPVGSPQEVVMTLGKFAGTHLSIALGHRESEERPPVSEGLAHRSVLQWGLYCG